MLKRAARATVAIWVLSPISAKKNTTTVAHSTPNAPLTALGFSVSSSLSGISIHAPIAMKPRPRIQRSSAGPTICVIQPPRAPARP